MFQRVQTLFLLAAFLLAGAYFVFPFSTKIFPGDLPGTDLVYRLTVFAIEKSEGGPFEQVTGVWLLPVLCSLTALASLAAMLLYGNRPLQMKACWAGVFCCLGVIIADYFISNAMAGGMEFPANAVYLYSSYLPVAQFVFLRLALHRIRKDEELVRSADRIR